MYHFATSLYFGFQSLLSAFLFSRAPTKAIRFTTALDLNA